MRAMLLSLAFVLFAPAAYADYRSEYSEYRLALKNGDYAGAAAHGEAAWRAAENELGDTKVTAILAFNYAELVVIREPRKSLEPYERARAISQVIESGLNAEDIDAGIAFAQFALAPDDETRRNRLEATLEARRANALPASAVSAYGWLALRAHDARRDRQRIRRTYSDRALADAEAMGEPADEVLMRSALIAVSKDQIASKPTRVEEFQEAASRLERAFKLFPPQESIESFDRALGDAIAWRYSIELIVRSGASNSSEEQQPAANVGQWFGWRSRPNLCSAVTWTGARLEDKLPGPDTHRDINGAVIIGYRIEGDKVERTTVIGDTHRVGLAKALSDFLMEGRAKNAQPPGCTDGIHSTSFVVNKVSNGRVTPIRR